MRDSRSRLLVSTALMTALLAPGCAGLGFRSRVLHSVPSPDGQFVVVCQEVPAYDGPDYDIRLHPPDGTLVRSVASHGDAYPCNEVVWSPDGRTLAVLARVNSFMTLVDIAAALRKPAEERLWNRTVTLTDRGEIPSNLRFVSPTRVAYVSCNYTLGSSPDTCGADARDRRLEL